METTSGINSRIGRHTLVWRKKFNIWWRNLNSFFGELRKHPLAMLGGLIVIVYLFAAIFADQGHRLAQRAIAVALCWCFAALAPNQNDRN